MMTRVTSAASSLAAIAVAFAVGSSLHAQEMDVDRSANRIVRFISRSQVDEFEGVTDHIDGYVLLDGQPLSASTGRGRHRAVPRGRPGEHRHRDRAAQPAHARQLPRGREVPVRVVQGSHRRGAGERGRRRKVTASGTFTIHGVSRERDITCDVSPVGEGYHAECAFAVLLSDHDIEIPKVMFLKLANEIRVEVEFTVSPAGKSAGGNP